MAGVRVTPGERVVFFGVVTDPAEAVVVTVAGATGALTGADAGAAKVSVLAEFPAKGRATGGVRAQRFLKGEDTLTLAWVGAEPRAVGTDGAARQLPAAGAKRDASGTPLDAVIGSVGTAVR